MKLLLVIVAILSFCELPGQPGNCEFKAPIITIDFGTGSVNDMNTIVPPHFQRTQSYCPHDGYYTYTDYTSDCFNSHWFTLTQDHTPGDVSGNMMLVNSSYYPGTFLKTRLSGLSAGSTYELALWLVNVCKISSYCPSLLLPDITILLQTSAGKTIAKFSTGELLRTESPHWKRYHAYFTAPASETPLTLTMIDSNPGGCGNDFALDDITLRECIRSAPLVATPPKLTRTTRETSAPKKQVAKKVIQPTVSQQKTTVISKSANQTPRPLPQVSKLKLPVMPRPPVVLTTRVNSLVKQIETEAGDIVVSLYDNGEVDGDTVSIYHNNELLMAHARLSQQPLTMTIAVDSLQPHHELIMVAENLGTIPPNTSLMIVTAGTKRYEVFISSTEQKNAKVVLDLKE